MCPLVDSANPRCSPKLTLRNLAAAFTHCADRYRECPVYRELLDRAIAEDLVAARACVRAAS